MLALSAGERRYRAVVEGLNDMAYAYDLRGIMTYVSPVVARYGFAVEEVVGKPMLDLMHPMYQVTASYGHFGRKPFDVTLANGEKFTAFSWEKTDRAEALKEDAKRIK